MEPRVVRTLKPISQARKIRKPIMEKKRRERINGCLQELKDMLIDENAVQRLGPKPSKLEKADILEQTVHHMRELHKMLRRGQCSDDTDVTGFSSTADSYRRGYQQCLKAVKSLSDAGSSSDSGALTGLVTNLQQRYDALHRHQQGGDEVVRRLDSADSAGEASPHSAADSFLSLDASRAWSGSEWEDSMEEDDALDLTSRVGGGAPWRPW